MRKFICSSSQRFKRSNLHLQSAWNVLWNTECNLLLKCVYWARIFCKTPIKWRWRFHKSNYSCQDCTIFFLNYVVFPQKISCFVWKEHMKPTSLSNVYNMFIPVDFVIFLDFEALLHCNSSCKFIIYAWFIGCVR